MPMAPQFAFVILVTRAFWDSIIRLGRDLVSLKLVLPTVIGWLGHQVARATPVSQERLMLSPTRPRFTAAAAPCQIAPSVLRTTLARVIMVHLEF